MKKLLLSMSTIVSIAAPIATVVACSTSDEIVKKYYKVGTAVFKPWAVNNAKRIDIDLIVNADINAETSIATFDKAESSLLKSIEYVYEYAKLVEFEEIRDIYIYNSEGRRMKRSLHGEGEDALKPLINDYFTAVNANDKDNPPLSKEEFTNQFAELLVNDLNGEKTPFELSEYEIEKALQDMENYARSLSSDYWFFGNKSTIIDPEKVSITEELTKLTGADFSKLNEILDSKKWIISQSLILGSANTLRFTVKDVKSEYTYNTQNTILKTKEFTDKDNKKATISAAGNIFNNFDEKIKTNYSKHEDFATAIQTYHDNLANPPGWGEFWKLPEADAISVLNISKADLDAYKASFNSKFEDLEFEFVIRGMNVGFFFDIGFGTKKQMENDLEYLQEWRVPLYTMNPSAGNSSDLSKILDISDENESGA